MKDVLHHRKISVFKINFIMNCCCLIPDITALVTVITLALIPCVTNHHNSVNKANLVHSLFLAYLFIKYLRVSGDCVPVVRRNDCVYGTLGICHSVWMTVLRAGWNSTLHARRSSVQSDKYQTSHIYSCFS